MLTSNTMSIIFIYQLSKTTLVKEEIGYHRALLKFILSQPAVLGLIFISFATFLGFILYQINMFVIDAPQYPERKNMSNILLRIVFLFCTFQNLAGLQFIYAVQALIHKADDMRMVTMSLEEVEKYIIHNSASIVNNKGTHI